MADREHIVGIAAKPKDKRATQLASELIDWLKARKISFRVGEEVVAELGSAVCPETVVVPRDKLTSVCNPIVVLGGDGTLISVARYPGTPAPIIIGVNAGTLGFLTELTGEELFSTLERTLEGKVECSERLLLDTTVKRADGKQENFSAINDVVITKEALARIFSVHLSVDGEPATVLRGDGVIVATPGGSTAYSLAAGGAIVHPRVDALLVTPICPHTLTSRPLVLPGESKIELKVDSSSLANNGDVFLTVDGQDGMVLSGGDEVLIQRSTATVRFATSVERNYFEVLSQKLKWAGK